MCPQIGPSQLVPCIARLPRGDRIDWFGLLGFSTLRLPAVHRSGNFPGRESFRFVLVCLVRDACSAHRSRNFGGGGDALQSIPFGHPFQVLAGNAPFGHFLALSYRTLALPLRILVVDALNFGIV